MNESVIQKVELLCKELLTLSKGIYFLKECTPRAKDRIYSIGERLSSTIFTECLQIILGDSAKVSFLDARDFLLPTLILIKLNLTRKKSQIVANHQEKLVADKNQYYVTQASLEKR